jgi:hypothetical protein
VCSAPIRHNHVKLGRYVCSKPRLLSHTWGRFINHILVIRASHTHIYIKTMVSNMGNFALGHCMKLILSVEHGKNRYLISMQKVSDNFNFCTNMYCYILYLYIFINLFLIICITFILKNIYYLDQNMKTHIARECKIPCPNHMKYKYRERVYCDDRWYLKYQALIKNDLFRVIFIAHIHTSILVFYI